MDLATVQNSVTQETNDKHCKTLNQKKQWNQSQIAAIQCCVPMKHNEPCSLQQIDTTNKTQIGRDFGSDRDLTNQFWAGDRRVSRSHYLLLLQSIPLSCILQSQAPPVVNAWFSLLGQPTTRQEQISLIFVVGLTQAEHCLQQHHIKGTEMTIWH